MTTFTIFVMEILTLLTALRQLSSGRTSGGAQVTLRIPQDSDTFLSFYELRPKSRYSITISSL